MAERIIGGILGEEDEKPDVEAKETLAVADAFAAAVAANAPGSVDNNRVFHGDRRAFLCRDLRVFVIPGTADVAHDC